MFAEASLWDQYAQQKLVCGCLSLLWQRNGSRYQAVPDWGRWLLSGALQVNLHDLEERGQFLMSLHIKSSCSNPLPSSSQLETFNF